jgi:hypothetical protein
MRSVGPVKKKEIVSQTIVVIGEERCPKTFAWLELQNRVWTTDRLQKRGCPNYGNCELYNQVQESAAHLLLHCLFTRRIWESLKSWLGLLHIQPQDWTALHSIKEWWRDVIQKKEANIEMP